MGMVKGISNLPLEKRKRLKEIESTVETWERQVFRDPFFVREGEVLDDEKIQEFADLVGSFAEPFIRLNDNLKTRTTVKDPDSLYYFGESFGNSSSVFDL